MFGFLRRKKADDEPVDMQARSPVTGLKYKDIALLGQMMQSGADLTKPRHVLYYLYFDREVAARSAADETTKAGFDSTVSEPLPGYPGQWRLRCERRDAVLDIEFVRGSDDLFEGVASRFGGEFDGWEASV